MDYQQIQEDIKQDLKSISEMNFGILPANIMYGETLKFSIKSAIAFLLINVLMQLAAKSVGFFYPSITPGWVVLTFVPAFFASLLLMPLTFNFVLFGKLFSGKLKTEALVKRKYAQLVRGFLMTYSIIYLLATVFFDSGIGLDAAAREHFGMWPSYFGLVMSQVFAFILALVISNILLYAEMNRLGLGMVLEGIGNLVKRAGSCNTHNELS